MSQIQTTTLENGLRIVTDTVPDVHTVAAGIWVGVGTRDEDLDAGGAAHMVEHMLFKGTQIRSAQDIVEVIENVGGHMNAYTSREITSYHIHLMKDDLSLALDVLADMVRNSTLPEEEIERERHVILQEIGMCHDTPDDLIFDNYYETAYPDQALGAPILGKTEIIQAMNRDTLSSYIENLYTPARMIVSAAGNLDHDEFVDQARELFSDMPETVPYETAPATYQGGENRVSKDLEQCHFVLGFQAPSRMDKDYYTARALSTLLGGGMSSRLFQEVREKRGLVYSIFSFHSAYMDDGQFGIYAGTGSDEIAEVIPVVCEEVQKLAGTLTDEELTRAKAQLKSTMLMGRESMMARADQQAKHLFYYKGAYDVESVIQEIDAVKVSSVQKIAQHIFSSRPTLAALGPLEKLEEYEHISERLVA